MSAKVSAIAARTAYDPQRVRRDFPILATQVNGHPLVNLDNAASGGTTTEKCLM